MHAGRQIMLGDICPVSLDRGEGTQGIYTPRGRGGSVLLTFDLHIIVILIFPFLILFIVFVSELFLGTPEDKSKTLLF